VNVNELLINSMGAKVPQPKRAVVKKASPDEVSELISRMVEPPCDGSQMESRLLSMRREYWNSVLPQQLLSVVARQYIADGQVGQARRVLSDCYRLTGHEEANPTVIQKTIYALCQAGAIGEALAVFWEVKPPGKWRKWHAAAMILLEACYASGDFEKATELLKELSASGALRPSTLGPFVSRAVDAGRLQTAERVVEDMIGLHHQPRPQVYAAIMGHYCKKADVAAVDRVAADMRKAGTNHTTYTYGYLIKARARAGRLDEAMELFMKMPEQGFHAQGSVYTVLVSELCRVGRLQEAQSVMEMMKVKGLQLNASMYANLAVGYLSAGDEEEAFHTLTAATADNVASLEEVVPAAHRVACITGNLAFANRLVEALPGGKGGNYQKRNEAAAHAHNGDFAAMLSVMATMANDSEGTSQTSAPIKRLLSTLVEAAVRGGTLSAAIEHMPAAADALEIRRLVFYELLLPFVDQSPDDYNRIFEYALESAMTAEEEDLTYFTSSLVFRGRDQELERLFSELPPSRYINCRVLYSSTMAAFSQEPEIAEKLLKVLRVLRKHGRNHYHVYKGFATKLIRQDMPELALEVARLDDTGEVMHMMKAMDQRRIELQAEREARKAEQ